MSEAANTPTWRVSTKLRVRSRALRRTMTDAERIVWYAVRAHRLSGASFRRQAPIGPFIVDFVCHDARLIIEIDGAQHFEAEHEKQDARRDAFLTARGYRVLRFNNRDVMTNRQGVVEAISAALVASPSLPSPASRGGDAYTAGSQAAPPSLSLPRKGGGNPETDSALAASPSLPSPASGGGRPDSESVA